VHSLHTHRVLHVARPLDPRLSSTQAERLRLDCSHHSRDTTLASNEKHDWSAKDPAPAVPSKEQRVTRVLRAPRGVPPLTWSNIAPRPTKCHFQMLVYSGRRRARDHTRAFSVQPRGASREPRPYSRCLHGRALGVLTSHALLGHLCCPNSGADSSYSAAAAPRPISPVSLQWLGVTKTSRHHKCVSAA